jgi:hypothetical protein
MSPRPGPAFSNGTEFDIWSATWCDTCLADRPFRNGISEWGCRLIEVATFEGIPDEWLDTGHPGDYRCTAYKPLGWRKPAPEPRPEPIPEGQLPLFGEDT